MAMDTGLEGRPWYFGVIVGLLTVAALGYVGYTLQIKGMLQTHRSQGSKLSQLETQIVRGEAAKEKLFQFRQEVAQLEAELGKFLKILPPRRDVPSVLRRFRALAEQGDFALNSFAPGLEVEKEFFNEWPIKVELQGSYHNLAEFFDRMSRFSRIFNVDNLKIVERAGGQHSIEASFVAKAFVFKDSKGGK